MKDAMKKSRFPQLRIDQDPEDGWWVISDGDQWISKHETKQGALLSFGLNAWYEGFEDAERWIIELQAQRPEWTLQQLVDAFAARKSVVKRAPPGAMPFYLEILPGTVAVEGLYGPDPEQPCEMSPDSPHEVWVSHLKREGSPGGDIEVAEKVELQAAREAAGNAVAQIDLLDIVEWAIRHGYLADPKRNDLCERGLASPPRKSTHSR
jgi:hypothetical protein